MALYSKFQFAPEEHVLGLGWVVWPGRVGLQDHPPVVKQNIGHDEHPPNFTVMGMPDCAASISSPPIPPVHTHPCPLDFQPDIWGAGRKSHGSDEKTWDFATTERQTSNLHQQIDSALHRCRHRGSGLRVRVVGVTEGRRLTAHLQQYVPVASGGSGHTAGEWPTLGVDLPAVDDQASRRQRLMLHGPVNEYATAAAARPALSVRSRQQQLMCLPRAQSCGAESAAKELQGGGAASGALVCKRGLGHVHKGWRDSLQTSAHRHCTPGEAGTEARNGRRPESQEWHGDSQPQGPGTVQGRAPARKGDDETPARAHPHTTQQREDAGTPPRFRAHAPAAPQFATGG